MWKTLQMVHSIGHPQEPVSTIKHARGQLDVNVYDHIKYLDGWNALYILRLLGFKDS